MRRLFVFLFVSTLQFSSTPTALAESLVFAPPERYQQQRAAADGKRAALEAIQMRNGGSNCDSWAPALPPSPFDVITYDLAIHLDMDRHIISGANTVLVEAIDDNLGMINLDADQGLRIFGVTLVDDQSFPYDSSRALDFTHHNDRLDVLLPRHLTAGERITLLISYSGRANRGGMGVNWHSHSGVPIAHTEAEPFGARVWFPCNDRPDDKAKVSLRTTAPAEFVVASNGLETSRTEDGSGQATTTWQSKYDVATYLVVMNVSNFVYSEIPYEALDGSSMPVVSFIYPELADQAAIDLAITPAMIEVMAEYFGEYPFVEEKYGNCSTPIGGGMEHQTLTSIAASAIGDPWMDWLNVHELGHEWWGDWVNNDDWKELWLNEGFASYTEWLWAEHLGGNVLAETKLDADFRGFFLGPLYDNPVPFSNTVYNKGAWTAHMLRTLLGDETFFEALKAYRERFGGGSATTEKFREVFEEISRQDLAYFFDQWVYGLNRPRIHYEWVAGTNTVKLTIWQKQSNAPLFAVPLEVEITTDIAVENHIVWLDAVDVQNIDLEVQGTTTAVRLDPNLNLLAEIAHVSEPDLDLGPRYPYDFDFGAAAFGDARYLTVPMTNLGGSDLTIEDIEKWYGSGISIESPRSFPISIRPGDTVNLELRFSGTPFGTNTSEFIIFSDDPSHDNMAFVRVQATGAFAEEPVLSIGTTLRIGEVPIGGIAEGSLSMRNIGGATMHLSATLTGDDFALASVIPQSLEPGQSALVAVSFAPTIVGDAEGTLVVETDDPQRPSTTITITATASAAPMIMMDPAILTIGADELQRSVTISNRGQVDLFITALEIDDAFALVEDWTLPITLTPGEKKELLVEVLTTTPGHHSGAIRLLSNDPGAPWALILLKTFNNDGLIDSSAIAAAARSGGFGGAQWFTDLTLLNPGNEDVAVDLVFRPAGERLDAGTDLSIWIPAGTQRTTEDIVTASGFSGSGGFNLTGTDALIGISRTYSRESYGTFGQAIPAVATNQAQVAGETYVLPGLATGGFHSNLGVLNLGNDALTLDVDLFATDGTLIGELKIKAAANAYAQENSVFSRFTSDEIRGGFARISSTDGEGPFHLWASVVDDVSHDPSFISPQNPNIDETDLIIAVVTNSEGNLGTSWRSELSIVNDGDLEAGVDIDFVTGAGFNHGISITLPPHSAWYIDDVLRGVERSIWLSITSDSGGIHASSRTYNFAGTGTFGQTIPAVDTSHLAHSGDSVLLAGLRSNDGFRSNLGFTSTSSHPTIVSVEVFAENGGSLGSFDVDLPGGAFVQVLRVLATEFAYEGRAWARITSPSADASYLAHASVIDDQTGDPIYIAGVIEATGRR